MTLQVRRIVGLATIQDLGIPGQMYEAMPPGGALVPELLVASNRRVDNPDDAACIEVLGQLTIHVATETTVSVDGGIPRGMSPRETIVVTSTRRRCTYVAVRGGLVGAMYRGRPRGTVLCAGIGGPLYAGAMVETAGLPRKVTPTLAFVESTTIGIIPGPDTDAFTDDALTVLTSAPYRILPASNRVGTRLAGPALARIAGYRERSRPMLRGALEVPGDGQPIVLGPEHPTTGGYPIAAVIATAELGRFFAIRLGGSVRFTVR